MQEIAKLADVAMSGEGVFGVAAGSACRMSDGGCFSLFFSHV